MSYEELNDKFKEPKNIGVIIENSIKKIDNNKFKEPSCCRVCLRCVIGNRLFKLLSYLSIPAIIFGLPLLINNQSPDVSYETGVFWMIILFFNLISTIFVIINVLGFCSEPEHLLRGVSNRMPSEIWRKGLVIIILISYWVGFFIGLVYFGDETDKRKQGNLDQSFQYATPINLGIAWAIGLCSGFVMLIISVLMIIIGAYCFNQFAMYWKQIRDEMGEVRVSEEEFMESSPGGIPAQVINSIQNDSNSNSSNIIEIKAPI